MLKIIKGGDPDATQPCAVVPDDEPGPANKIGTIRNLDAHRWAQIARLREDVRAEVAAEAFQAATDYLSTGLDPRFVAALRGDAPEVTVRIGATNALITFGQRPAAIMGPDQIKKTWDVTAKIFDDVGKLPYLKTHFANDLPTAIRSLEWATEHGPVIVARTEAFRRRRRCVPKFLTGHGPASLVPILGIGGPKLTAILTACVGVCVAAEMTVPGSPITSPAPGGQPRVVMREEYVPPLRPVGGVTSPAAPVLTVKVSARPTPKSDGPAHTHQPVLAPRPATTATPAPTAAPTQLVAPATPPIDIPPAVAPAVTDVPPLLVAPGS